MPSHKYVPGYEIHEHALRIAEQGNFRPRAFFQTEVTALKWSDALSRWIAGTTRGDCIRAKFVVSAIGILHKLHLPGIAGIENFKGDSFHSARWDYNITGGDRHGAKLDKLTGKRVALIGTGASTIQVLPHLTKSGAEVYVFQRTPSSVDERVITPTDEAWYKTLQPGWQADRINNFDAVFSGAPADTDLVDDGWTELPYSISKSLGTDNSATEREKRYKEAELKKMEQLRARIQHIVKDTAISEGLKPWYGRNCKRPCFHNDYLPCFNQPNVHLVNTDGKGVARVTSDSVESNGKEYPVDCIIYATGFEWATDFSQRANMVITGRGNQTLSEKWKDGPYTYQGMMSRGFPNLLIFTHLQSSTSPNYTGLLNERAKHAAYIISETLKRGKDFVEPTQEAEDEWVKKLEGVASQYLEYFKACTPGEKSQSTANLPAVDSRCG